MSDKCDRPSPGWKCFLDKDHKGPCPAWPTKPEQLPWAFDPDTDLTTECLAIATDLIIRQIKLPPGAGNDFLKLALEWIDKAKLYHIPPFPPTKSGAPGELGLH
jgi:hypothetical protein